MEIQFLGAAQSVTGSMHLLRTKRAVVLLDCGLFQGRRRESFERNRNLPPEACTADAVVLSHAHIDHSGALPMLTKAGFRGPIYTTPATRDLIALMLADAAMIQESDARHINRIIERDQVDIEPVEPLYEQKDVAVVLAQTTGVPYHRRTRVAAGVDLTLLDAGHVLGSAIVVLDVDEDGKKRRVVFTGDLGRRNMPILRDPEVASGADFLILESTYGDRLHDPIERMEDELAEVVARTHQRGGKIIIPSFALERAQEVLFALQALRQRGRLPEMKIYVDSPLTVGITEVFRLHPDCYDQEARQRLAAHDTPFDFPGVTYVPDVEASKELDLDPAPAIIISASGMCEGGRVLHHLKAAIEDPKNTVVIVGFQADHTLGRRIVERRPKVKIFGIERELRAEVVVLNGFSAHADQADLVHYAGQVADRGSLEGIALVHGERKAQEALREKLAEQRLHQVQIPARGDVIRL
ncbi:MAG: MBL fold metallo-hydrolase [Deltaproteobacteria bacterium]|nr:MBL fold metallo-hydrolase [Deltaproteobacteria bacterium]